MLWEINLLEVVEEVVGDVAVLAHVYAALEGGHREHNDDDDRD